MTIAAYHVTVPINYSHVTAKIKGTFFVGFLASAAYLQPVYYYNRCNHVTAAFTLSFFLGFLHVQHTCSLLML